MNTRRVGPDPEDRVPTVPCHLHEEPNPWCPVCRTAPDRYTLTGLQRTYLDTVRERYVGKPMDSVPVVNWNELLDLVERDVRGETS